MTQDIHIFDVDGTLIDTARVVRECQIKGLVRATGMPFQKLEEMLDTKGLTSLLAELDIPNDVFFNDFYKTFDPEEARRQGHARLFSDSEDALRRSGYAIALSNSEQRSTERKLAAFDIAKYMKHTFAEHENVKAKPGTYMGERALEALSREGMLRNDPWLIMIGDHPRDIEFASNLRSAYRKIRNIFIDRKGKGYDGVVQPDTIVRSLNDI